jgi:6-phosphogluconolactonase
VWGVAYRWISLTNGDNGISITSRPSPFGLSLASPRSFYWATLVVFLVTVLSMAIFVASPFGASVRGTRDQPRRMNALGYHVWMIRFLAFLFSGFWSGVAGLLYLYYNLASGALSPNTVPFAPVASGSGPRHMAFHPDRRRAYVLDELVSSITVFDYDPDRGALIWVQTISTLPPRFTGANTTAEIRIHPDGHFLYNTNRGHNSITMYEIDAATGELDVIGWESTRGEWPRGMNIDPSGTFLYAANQNTDTIAVFRIQRSNGKLKQNALVSTPTPVDIEFGPLA